MIPASRRRYHHRVPDIPDAITEKPDSADTMSWRCIQIEQGLLTMLARNADVMSGVPISLTVSTA